MLDFVHSSGDLGKPVQKLSAPVFVDKTIHTDAIVGDGLRVTSDAQDAIFSVTIANGATGETLISSGTQVQPLAKWRTSYSGLADMMMCATEGSRIIGAIPASDLSPEAAKSMRISADQAIVVTLDLQKVYLAAADGAPQYNDRRGMPSVVLAPDGRPGVIVPDVAPPTELAVEVLKKGDGPVVADSDSVRVHYTGVGWLDRTVSGTTWEDGAPTAVVPSSKKALPFAAELTGQSVGSQLLVVIPAPAGTGKPDATVYVVDILGIDDPALAQTQ